MIQQEFIPQVRVSEAITYESSRNVNAMAKFVMPHRVESGCLVFITQGHGHLLVDMRSYNTAGGMVVTLLPGKLLQLTNHSDDFSCEVIGFSPDIISEVEIVKAIMARFQTISSHPVIIPNQDDWLLLMSNLQLLSKFYHYSLPLDTCNSIVHHQLLSLLFYVFALYDNQERLDSVSNITRKEELVRQFTHRIMEDFRRERSVNYYADCLCVSAKYLSAVVKEVMGKKASQMIADTVILEAKAMISNSDMTIQQIADALNFANVSFFGKFFKKHVGMAPKQFRNKSAKL